MRWCELCLVSSYHKGLFPVHLERVARFRSRVKIGWWKAGTGIETRQVFRRLSKIIGKTAPPNQICMLAGVTAASFSLTSQADYGETIEEVHYVVRNSSTQALSGFCSTYFYTTTLVGMIGSIFVDPAKRNLSIGHSLHQRDVRDRLQKHNIKKLQLWLGLPGIYLGIPMSDLSEGARLKRRFATNDSDILSLRLLYMLTVRNLTNWAPPDGLLPRIQRVSFAFDLTHGTENSETVLDHVKTNS